MGESQLEKVLSEHGETQKQLERLQLELAKATTENSQMAAHYQHYTAELATQTQALQEQVRLDKFFPSSSIVRKSLVHSSPLCCHHCVAVCVGGGW